jgi:site-specific recombinase XerD
MLESSFVEGRTGGLFGSHLASFVAAVLKLGYARRTVQNQVCLLGHLERWLGRKRLALVDLQEQEVDRFLMKRRRERHLVSGDLRTAWHFLEHLREKGVVPSPEPTADESPLATLRKRYENYLLTERGLSPTTLPVYWAVLRKFIVERFGSAPDATICVRDLVPKDISAFLLRHACPGTGKKLVSPLRSFFRFLYQHGVTETDLARAVPTIPGWRFSDVPQYLRPEEVERVIRACEHGNTVAACRNRAIILLLARLGLRAGEVRALELDDIDWRSGVLTVRGKGGYRDRLPLPADIGEALAIYLRQHRPPCTTRRVFIRSTAPHRGFSSSGAITTIVHRALDIAGLHPRRKGAHVLRHSLATGMLRAGASMNEIGEVLRHRITDTTEIYAKVDIKSLRALALPWPTKGGVR